MKLAPARHLRRAVSVAAFTLIEMLVTVVLGVVLTLGVMILYVDGNQCFVAMANYQNLDKTSCNALDTLTRQIRGDSALMSYQSTSFLLFTNDTLGRSDRIAFNANAGTLTLTTTQNGVTTVTTNLTGCDTWTCSLYDGVPTNSMTDISFYPTTDPASTKVVQMNWKCSRSYLGTKLETESVQTAQIVLRNKVAD
jgi:Tfp pilus assembly protein PilW